MAYRLARRGSGPGQFTFDEYYGNAPYTQKNYLNKFCIWYWHELYKPGDPGTNGGCGPA